MFKTFPEFSKLTLADKEEYESLVKDFPPFSSISFFTLIIWWGSFDHLVISKLNGNLVVHYWRPGEEKNSGFSLIGTNKIDESLCVMFDYLREKGEDIRLVQVPEFTVTAIDYPDMYRFKEPRGYNEYIMPLRNFYPVSNLKSFRQAKVDKFFRVVHTKIARVEQIDVSKKSNQQLILNSDELWWRRRTINDFGRMERDLMRKTVRQAAQLGLQCIGLYVADKLHAFCLYEPCRDKDYVLIAFIRQNHEIPGTLDFMASSFSQWFIDHGAAYVNLDIDLGLPQLRAVKLGLGPINFFRKYTIEPA